MKRALLGCLTVSLLALSAPAAFSQGLMESASLYSKGGGLGAGLGAAVGASMKQAAGGDKNAPKLSPQQLEQAEANSKQLSAWALGERKQGHLDAAVEVYHKLAEWRQHLFGITDKQAQDALVKAGDLSVQQKKYAVAENDFRSALKAGARTYGPGARELAPLLSKLGSVTCAQGNYHDAEGFVLQAVALRERQFGKTDERTVQAKLQMCDVLQKAAQRFREVNNNDQAEIIEQKMKALKSEIDGTSAPSAPPTDTTGGAQPPASAGGSQ